MVDSGALPPVPDFPTLKPVAALAPADSDFRPSCTAAPVMPAVVAEAGGVTDLWLGSSYIERCSFQCHSACRDPVRCRFSHLRPGSGMAEVAGEIARLKAIPNGVLRFTTPRSGGVTYDCTHDLRE